MHNMLSLCIYNQVGAATTGIHHRHVGMSSFAKYSEFRIGRTDNGLVIQKKKNNSRLNIISIQDLQNSFTVNFYHNEMYSCFPST